MNLNTFLSNHTVDIIIPVGCAIVAILAGLGGVWWGNRHSRKLARESGALKQRKLGLFIGNHEIREREIWCYCFPEYEADKSCVEMDLQVVNKGGLTCDGVTVTVNTVKDLLSSYSPKKGHPTHKAFPAVLEDDFKRGVGDTDDLHRHVSYMVPPIPPKGMVTLTEWIFLRQTVDIPESAGAKTKDNKKVEMKWRMSLSWPMTLTAIATDCEPINAKLEVFGVQANSIPDALQQLLRVASITPPGLEITGSVPQHQLRFFKLKQCRREKFDNKVVIVFKADEMKLEVLEAPLASLSMKPRVGLLSIERGKQRKSETKV